MIQWRDHRIEDVEVDLLLQALLRRYGYDFTGYARASLKRRLKDLQSYFDVKELSALIPPLLHDERVAQTLVNNISVPVSEFFRDPPVWRHLRDEIFPRLDSFPHINSCTRPVCSGKRAWSPPTSMPRRSRKPATAAGQPVNSIAGKRLIGLRAARRIFPTIFAMKAVMCLSLNHCAMPSNSITITWWSMTSLWKRSSLSVVTC
jgi:chemotaxis protein methyltransferase CheR